MPLTPPVLWLCWNYPIQRKRFFSRLSLHFASEFTFYDHPCDAPDPALSQDGGEVIAVTQPAVWKTMFCIRIHNIVNTYAMIAFLRAHDAFVSRMRARELRSAQLEGKLAKAQLSMLKMQLQPHFLFNTLNAVSALTRIILTRRGYAGSAQ